MRSLRHFAPTLPLYFHPRLIDSWKMEAVCEDEVENYTERDEDWVHAFVSCTRTHNVIYSDGIPFNLFHLDQICFPQTNNTY